MNHRALYLHPRWTALRPAAALFVAWLMCLSAWAQTPPVQPVLISPAPGQTPTDIALEQVPAGISFEQFLLALLRLNPQLAGSNQALQSSLKLQLPSTAQASAIAPEQARAQLLALRRPNPSPKLSSSPGPSSAASEALPAASPELAAGPSPAASESQGQTSAASPAPAASQAVVSPAAASDKSLPVDPLMLISVGAALLVILLLAFKRPEGEKPPAPSTKPPAPRPRRAEPETTAAGAQERFRPALPLVDANPPRAAQSQPAAVTQASAPPASVAKLSDLGPLPSLDLSEPAPAISAPKAPPAASAGPLDLSRISLDLSDPPRREP